MAEIPRAGERQAGADSRWLHAAIELSRRCPPSATAFSVGAILVGQSGTVISTGFSRERDPADHAEEVALARAADAAPPGGPPGGPAGGLAGATIYSSLEPCLSRTSRPRPCAQLIVAAGIGRVVVAWLEPPLFVPGGGAAWLRGQGVTVIEVRQAAAAARAVNAHLLSQ